jgi:membrane protease YdiL (CAAX protease family)
MESRNQNLFKALKLYLLYVLIVLIATPLAVYIISFLAENYLFGQNVSFESISDSSILDDIILILGNLLIILLFLKKRWTNVNESCSRTAMASFDKGLLLWILILELSAILPTNLFVGILNLSDFDAATSDSATSMAAVVGICLLAPFAEELVMRGGVEEHLLQWKHSPALAIVLSSLLWSVLHFSPSLIISAFLSGLLLGWVYYRTRNVLACFLMHMLNNTASCIGEWLIPDDTTSLDILFQTRVIIITLFGIVLMIASLVNIQKRTSPMA